MIPQENILPDLYYPSPSSVVLCINNKTKHFGLLFSDEICSDTILSKLWVHVQVSNNKWTISWSPIGAKKEFLLDVSLDDVISWVFYGDIMRLFMGS